MMFGDRAEILQPASLKERIKAIGQAILQKNL